MARYYYCWLKVLICLCSPCICLALLFVIMLCMTMNGAATSRSWIYGLDTPHFVASGTLRKQGVAPLPETFWDLYPNGDALWNRLQLVMDRHYNPILQPNKIKRDFENSNFDETLLRQSFSEVISLDGKQRNFDELPQQLQDFVRNMHMRDYPTIFKPDGVCGVGAKDEKEPPLLLMAIKTSTGRPFDRPGARRDGWQDRRGTAEEEKRVEDMSAGCSC